MDILERIVVSTKKRVEAAKEKEPLQSLKERAKRESSDFIFERALKKPGLSFICEIKKASPSKGVISQELSPSEVARAYADAGADAVSVLTEPEFFQGSNEYLSQASRAVELPILRKDFIVDEYQIYEAKAIGASAVLLIASLLSTARIAEYVEISDSLGLSALLETRTAAEIASAVSAGARIIGVNNRNLKSFKVDIGIGIRLRELVPPDKIFVSESGIKTVEDIRVLKRNAVDAVLIGETLMVAEDKKAVLAAFRDA